MNVIEIQNLTKIYSAGKVMALSDVSLSVEQGEIYALLGPNGAGKTTLFKTLLGITNITSGTAQINGLPHSDPKSRQKIGYLPENHRFPSYLNGLELLKLTGSLYGHSPGTINNRTDELLELVGMKSRAKVKLKRCSKGMVQRIGLAQAMISDPDILLLDEPTDGVDPVGKIEIREVLKRARDDGKSIVLNSHLLSEVESVADRVAILSKGKLLRVGPVDELTSRQSQYEIEANLRDHELKLPSDIGQVLSAAGDKLTVTLADQRCINYVIDELRKSNIDIRSVKPLKITLEQLFLETITDNQGTSQ